MMANFSTAYCQLPHNHVNDPVIAGLTVRSYLGDIAIALANKMIGQAAMKTTMAKATSSDK